MRVVLAFYLPLPYDGVRRWEKAVAERMTHMENNRPDFMKNRPGAQSANQIQDVYGSQKRSTRVTVTIVLAVIDLIILVIGLVTGNNFITVIFAPLLLILIVSIFIGIRADRQNTPPAASEDTDAIFKEHDE